MFLELCIIFLLSGSVCIILPWLMPSGTFLYVVWLGMTVMGVMICWIGVILLIMRVVSTHAHLFLPMAKPNEVISLHERRGGNGAFRRGKLDALEHILLKGMIFRDTGGGTRVAGHRVIKTMETVNHNVPDWVAQYLFQIRDKYMVESPEALQSLYKALRGLIQPIDKVDVSSLESQLSRIPELKVCMQDPEHKKALLSMSVQQLQQMSECLYHGQVVHFEDYERFQEAAAPYDLESYTKRREVHRLMQIMHYKDPTQQDWMKWVMAISILLILGGIAYAIFAGA